MALFSVRIVTTDCRMDEPIPGTDVTYSDFRNHPVYKVPVIRIFGSTPMGQKTCLCLHGIFPYLYVAIDGGFNPSDFQLQHFACSIDKALNIAQGRSSSTAQHVYKIILVSCIPFYGFHAKEQLFLKIFLYSPLMVKKVADLLIAGAIMNRTFQPHESHIPYVLQTFMDYNLFGMNFVHLSSVKFRSPLPPFQGNKSKQWNSKTVTKEMICAEKRATLCELEVDGLGCHILNTNDISVAGNPGLLALWQEERMRCIKKNISSQLTPPSSPDRCVQRLTFEKELKKRLKSILDSLKPSEQHQEISSSNESFALDNEAEPTICERTILDVVQQSESFQDASSLDVSSADISFVNLLASLANARQQSQRHQNMLDVEEWDSVLSQKSSQVKKKDLINVSTKDGNDNDDDNVDEEEEDRIVTLEMSQCFDPACDRVNDTSEYEEPRHDAGTKFISRVNKLKRKSSSSSSTTSLGAKKLLKLKSDLLKGQRKKSQKIDKDEVPDRAEFTLLNKKSDFEKKERPCSFKESNLNETSIVFEDNFEKEKSAGSRQKKDQECRENPDAFTNLMNNLKLKFKNKTEQSVNSSQNSQPDVLENLAFLSSPESSICVTEFPFEFCGTDKEDDCQTMIEQNPRSSVISEIQRRTKKIVKNKIENILGDSPSFLNLNETSVATGNHESDVRSVLQDATVKQNQDATVKQNQDATVKQNQDATVKQNQDATVKQNQDATVKQNQDVTVNQNQDMHEIVKHRQPRLKKLSVAIPPLSYQDIMKDVIAGKLPRGTDASNETSAGSAKSILNKKLIPSQSCNHLKFCAHRVEDLSEYQTDQSVFGINQAMKCVKARAELSGACKNISSGSKKKKFKHILLPLLDDDVVISIVPHVSPPTYASVKSQVNSSKSRRDGLKQCDFVVEDSLEVDPKGSKFQAEKLDDDVGTSCIKMTAVESRVEVSMTLGKIDENVVSSSPTMSSGKKKIYSSTPFHSTSSTNSRLARLPAVNIDVTPIEKSSTTDDSFDVETSIINPNETASRTLTPQDFLHREEKLTNITKAKKTLFGLNSTKQKRVKNSESQIEAATPTNTFNFKVDSQNLQEIKASEHQHLSILSLELHISTRSHLSPDPDCDAISAAFYHIHKDEPPAQLVNNVDCSTDTICGEKSLPSVSYDKVEDSKLRPEDSDLSGVFVYAAQDWMAESDLRMNLQYRNNIKLIFCSSELELIMKVVELVQRIDADMLVGYEIQKLSWGYLIQRAAFLNIYLPDKLSRFSESKQSVRKNNIQNESVDLISEDYRAVSNISILGRIVLNLWRIFRHETALNVYTFENLAFHILHQRFPHFSFQTLTFWFNQKSHLHRWKVIEYYTIRCRGNLQMMEQMDLVGQTSEFARIYGIEFFDVLNRGSQYRVESMMLRLAKPQNFIAVSPSVQQRAAMRSPECIPLNLEPRSDFYVDPVVLLDFQSLYPSIMIAYNYCFSTCLGRMQHFSKLDEGPFEFGCTSLQLSPQLLESLKNKVNVCSNGVVFIKPGVRKGILPLMVEEILNTRVMVKKAMKIHKNEKGLQRILHSRQLGLKLIANVTFGYTAANFSGRMACTEVGDSIVRMARDTLEAAIQLVEQTEKWGARVIYGDTDSLFVLLKGRTKEQAFAIGQEIVDAVTNSNPKPIKLKLEKVYLPCVLQTKKRYVGFMYESPDQKEPIFDAKGIETVRRDNCPAVSKILEKSLKILFTSCDLNSVKKFVLSQCKKILEERTSLQDFIFAKEYRGLTGYKPTACVPALEIARRRLSKDARSEPLSGERVPYVIVCGSPSLPLIKLVRQPQELVEDSALRINYKYYLLKQILPPINRFAMLFGVDAFQWYEELPRVIKTSTKMFSFPAAIRRPGVEVNDTLSQYMSTLDCFICGNLTSSGICSSCKEDEQRRTFLVCSQIRQIEVKLHTAMQICTVCKGWEELENSCTSCDCPIFFKIVKQERKLPCLDALSRILNEERL